MTKFLLCLLFLTSPRLLADDSITRSRYYKTIRDALLCKNDSLKAIRGLVPKKTQIAKVGIDLVDHSVPGEQVDEEITITLKDPLAIFGAKTQAVHLGFAGGLLVYGEFKGNVKTIVKKLGLKKTKSGIAEYVDPLPPRNACPPTIGLTSNGSQNFRLGCGWCNG